MSKKLYFLVFLCFFVVSPIVIFAQTPLQQSDFYGSWDWSNMTTIFSATEMNFEIHLGENAIKHKNDIVTWTALANTNERTKRNYPAGYKIIVRRNSDREIQELTFFMHVNKKEMIFVFDNDYNVYTKRK